MPSRPLSGRRGELDPPPVSIAGRRLVRDLGFGAPENFRANRRQCAASTTRRSRTLPQHGRSRPREAACRVPLVVRAPTCYAA